MMNNETTQAETKGGIPFPSHVHSPAPNTDVQAVSREIVDTARDKNNLLDSAGNVHYLVRDHYVDTQTGTYGIESLIASILKASGAVFPKGIEETEFRNVTIAASLFTTQVIEAVRDTFGNERYPDATILSYLAHFMLKNGKVGKLKLKGHEDTDRKSDKPRVKYYLIEQ